MMNWPAAACATLSSPWATPPPLSHRQSTSSQSALIAQVTCLITDLQMPGQSGIELQEALRSRGYQMPVILVTAYPNDKDRTRALNNGAVEFLSKPFDDRWLIECPTDAIKLHQKSGSGCRAK